MLRQIMPLSTISDSLLRFRVLIARLRWGAFVLSFVVVLKLKDALGLTDRDQILLFAIIGSFAFLAAFDEYVLRKGGRWLRVGLYAVTLGDLAVLSAVFLLLPLSLVEYPVLFLLPVTVAAIGLGVLGGIVAGILSAEVVLFLAGSRGEFLFQGFSLFWPVVFIVAGVAVGYAVQKWDLAQQHLERVSYWIGKVNAAMTMAEIGETTLDYLANVAQGEGESTEPKLTEPQNPSAGALLLLDQGEDRYYAVATRNLSAETAARLWLSASDPMLNWMLRKGEPLWVSMGGARGTIRLPKVAELSRFSHFLFAPLSEEGTPIGVAILFVAGKGEGGKEALGGVSQFCRKVTGILKQTMFHSGLAHHAGAASAILESSQSVMGQGVDKVLRWAVDAACQLLVADLGAVAIAEHGGRLVIRVASGGKSNLTGYDLSEASSLGDWVMRMGEPLMVHDCATDPRLRRGSLLEQEVASLVAIPLRVYGQVPGILLLGRHVKLGFTVSDVRLLAMLGQQVTLLLERAGRPGEGRALGESRGFPEGAPGEGSTVATAQALGQRTEVRSSVVQVLSLVVEANKRYLEGSNRRVASLAVAIGERMGCSPGELRDLEYSALVRDVGIVGFEPGLLDRPSELTEEEMTRVRQHTIVGQTILSSLPFVWSVPTIIRHHHERYDGSGYPDYLKADQIPLCARILAVADVFDALTSKRPYRGALSPEDAREVVARGAGSQFDPAVVDAFLAIYKERYDRATEELLPSVVHVLSLVVEANKRYLEGSNRRVASLAVAIGERMGCSGDELRALECSALLRDVGIIGTEAGLLDRPGELTEEEMARVRQHTVVGQMILSSLPFVWDVPTIVRHHHERYDGSGYPDHLKADQIPLCARILAVADVFDALSSKRPYRLPLSPKDAGEVVARGARSQFDPAVVEAFRAVYKERYDIVSWLSGGGG